VQCGAAKSACGACQGRKTQRSRFPRVGGCLLLASMPPGREGLQTAKTQTAATTGDVLEPGAQIPRMDAKDDKAHDGARIRALWQKERHDVYCHVVFCWFLDESSLSGGVAKPWYCSGGLQEPSPPSRLHVLVLLGPQCEMRRRPIPNAVQDLQRHGVSCLAGFSAHVRVCSPVAIFGSGARRSRRRHAPTN